MKEIDLLFVTTHVFMQVNNRDLQVNEKLSDIVVSCTGQ